MRVFVTGSSGHLAAALLPKLCAQPEIDRVCGIDVTPPRFRHPKFHPSILDIRDPAIVRLLGGHDVLIHLAFVVLRGRMRPRAMHDINVSGSRHVFEAARRSGVRRFIHLSSAAVYGSGSGLAEDAPLDPLPGFLYAAHKVEVETMLVNEFPDCIRLRPHAILGPGAQPLLRQLLRQPFHLRIPAPQPRLQCVHEDDAANAVLLALTSNACGPFNLAAAESFSLGDVVRRTRRFSAALPLWSVRTGMKLAWHVSGWGGEPAWIEGLSRTLILDCTRARRELGWGARHDVAATLAATVA